MSSYDLRTESWIPFRRRSGVVHWGTLASLTSDLLGNPVVALATPRADFDGAVQEFLIGLLTIALNPVDEAAWRALWDEPPSPAALQAALDALPPAFDLDGDGPRFLQDITAEDFAEVEAAPIEQVLVDTPGDQTIRLNKDLFVKRGRVNQLGRPAAAMALLTLQTYAPAGGQGHRTSVRGGGPLTTLIEPRVASDGELRAHEQPLWRKLWANVETQHAWAARGPSNGRGASRTVFPWMSATRTSEKGARPTTPQDAHPLQAYFGMPRRVRLEFGEAGRCDLTGLDDARTVVGFRMRNYGPQYLGWHHPLTPHYLKDGEWLPTHGQPGGVGWRDWLGLTLREADSATRRPASVVAAFPQRRADLDMPVVRLHAFGYDMDNMKARGWTEALLPLYPVDEDRGPIVYVTANRLTEAAGIAASALLAAIKAALFERPEDAAGDFGSAKLNFWAATEADFYSAIEAITLSAAPIADVQALVEERCHAFGRVLAQRTPEIFDRWAPGAGLTPEAMRRRVSARYHLLGTLRGRSKLGEKLFAALGLAPPERRRPARTTTRTRSGGKR